MEGAQVDTGTAVRANLDGAGDGFGALDGGMEGNRVGVVDGNVLFAKVGNIEGCRINGRTNDGILDGGFEDEVGILDKGTLDGRVEGLILTIKAHCSCTKLRFHCW